MAHLCNNELLHRHVRMATKSSKGLGQRRPLNQNSLSGSASPQICLAAQPKTIDRLPDSAVVSTSTPLIAQAHLSTPRSPASPSSLLAGVSPRRPVIPHRSVQVLTSSSIAAATDAASDEAASRPLQYVAYQGVPGAYSEMAARSACGDYEPLPCDQFEVAFQALSQWMADRAVLPIENSLGGSIHTVYDLLLRYRLHIVGETSVAVNHCLMALPGTKMSQLKRVMSHPQALAQCENYLRKLNVVKEAVDDTAGAARMVMQQKLKDVGAVASKRAAQLYGLEVLDHKIQDMKENVTRFLVLSRDPLVFTEAESRTRKYKTSIVFSLKEGPGQLFKALSVFALRDIDMTKIESRPLRSNPIVVSSGDGGRSFNYIFYLDFIGTLSDPLCQNALRHLQEISPFMRVLGSYPADTELGIVSSDEPEGTTPAKQ